MQLHSEKRLPLSVIAELLNRSRIQTWSSAVLDTEGNIFASSGNVKDIEGNITSKKVVLDLVAILTANYLGFLEKLKDVFEEIFVSQALLDEINDELLNERIDLSKKRGSLSRVKDGYQSYEYSETELQEYTLFLTSLRDFVINKTKIVPIPSVLSIDENKLDELKKVLGESAVASILIAKEKGALLYADDLTISQIAKKEWSVDSIWSQIVLSNLRINEAVTEYEYHQGIYKLIIANYKFVVFNLEDLLWAAKENDWKATNNLQRFLQVVEGPDCDEDWAVEACSDLIKQGVLNISQNENRLFFIDFILRALVKGRNRLILLERLKSRLIAKFNLLPIQLSEALRTVNLWKQRTDTNSQ